MPKDQETCLQGQENEKGTKMSQYKRKTSRKQNQNTSLQQLTAYKGSKEENERQKMQDIQKNN